MTLPKIQLKPESHSFWEIDEIPMSHRFDFKKICMFCGTGREVIQLKERPLLLRTDGLNIVERQFPLRGCVCKDCREKYRLK